MSDSIRSSHLRISALFSDAAPLQPVIDRLRKQGVSDRDLAVFAHRPIHVNLPRDVSFLVRVAIIAGIIGIGLGVALTAGTALLYPLKTGGKPIVALPVVGLISYETMMLCAIVATFTALVLSIRRTSAHVSAHRALHDDSAGLAIRLDIDDRRAGSVRRVLEEAGAAEITVVRDDA
jgi:hypothetical protein